MCSRKRKRGIIESSSEDDSRSNISNLLASDSDESSESSESSKSSESIPSESSESSDPIPSESLKSQENIEGTLYLTKFNKSEYKFQQMKVGRTTDFDSRMQSYQTGGQAEIIIFSQVKNQYYAESLFLALVYPFRLRTEKNNLSEKILMPIEVARVIFIWCVRRVEQYGVEIPALDHKGHHFRLKFEKDIHTKGISIEMWYDLYLSLMSEFPNVRQNRYINIFNVDSYRIRMIKMIYIIRFNMIDNDVSIMTKHLDTNVSDHKFEEHNVRLSDFRNAYYHVYLTKKRIGETMLTFEQMSNVYFNELPEDIICPYIE